MDGTRNSAGDITHYAEIVIDFRGHREKLIAEITDLGGHQMIIGYTWLKHHNPDIDWETGQVRMTRCPWTCRVLQGKSPLEQSINALDQNGLRTIQAIKREQEWLETLKPEDLVPKTYHKYLKVFSKKESERMPVHKPWDHAIDMTDTFVPKKGRLIPLSPQEQKEVSDFIDDQTRKGYIRPSKSLQTFSMFFVPKEDGKKKMVQDYRYLNEHTVKKNYPLPLIQQLSKKLQGAKLFTKMDLWWGYNNVRIKEGDKWKAAFTCHWGSFEPPVMYFGLCNSPATFQAIMNEIFADMEDIVVVYIDNLLIFTKTNNQEEHDKIVLEVLWRLEEHDLFIKPEKCSFRVKEVKFLGMTVSAKGIKMNNDKVKAILEWPTPKTVCGVRSFLGLANFYQRFIKDYAQVARSLNDLTKKDQAFEWKESQQTAFDTLKQCFTMAPILAFPDINKQFRLETDASDFATSAVLFILKDDKWHPIAYSLHSMSPEEHNYPITDKEMLSVIQSLEEWRHYLEGANLQFKVWNDHANLHWFMKWQDLNCQQARWAQYLSRFNFKWVHKAWAQMGKPDALSHWEDHPVGIQDNNKMVLVIPPEQITSTTLHIATDADDIRNHIQDAMVQIQESDVITLCKKHGICEDQDRILFTKSGKMYVPEDRDLWMEIVCLHHDTPIPGHPGTEKTLELMQRSYTWPGIPTLVKDYVSRCDRCARFKGSNQAPPGKLKSLNTPPGPWKEISADFITDLSNLKDSTVSW